MQLSTAASAVAPGVTVAELFDRVADPAAAAEFFRGYGPIPAIAEVRMLTPAPIATGSRREVVLTDGSKLAEEVIEFEPPRLHRYRIVRFGPPLSRLLRTGQGTWSFTPERDGARVTWSYEYELVSVWAWPVAVLFVKVLMRGAMRRAVAQLCLPRTSSRQQANV